MWRGAATRWLLLCLAVVFLTGWIYEIRPLATVWGPVGTWVGGIATALGLIFTGVQIRDSRIQRSEEEIRRQEEVLAQREAMARAVSVVSQIVEDAGSWRIQYTIVNGSDYPIDTVVLFLHDHGQWNNADIDGEPIPVELVIGSMYQKQIIEDHHKGDGRARANVPFALLTGMGEVRFTDSWGQSWARSPGCLQKLDSPPRVC